MAQATLNPLAARYRDRFPILRERVYMVSHSLGAVPESAAAALRDYYDHWARRGVLAWDEAWWDAVLAFCADIEAILGAPAESVAPMQNVTRAFAGVASCFDWRSPRNKVVLTGLEFATTYPFWRGVERAGARLVVVESEDGFTVPTERIVDAIDDETALVLVSHVYYRSASVQEIEPVAAAARERGAMTLVDGYQAVGALPMNVAATGADFYTGGAHKWLCGGPGASFLYVRPERLAELAPRYTGWWGLADPFSFDEGHGAGEMSSGVFKFLCGTPNVPAIFAAREGVKLVRSIGVAAIRAAHVALSEEIVRRARERGMQIRGHEEMARRTGMTCIDFPGSREVAEALNTGDVSVDWRPGCGMRVSGHFYTTGEDIDAMFDAIDRAREVP